MINRPYDWTPLGYSSDPIPGSPAELESCTASYRRTAEQIEKAAWNLDKLKNGDEMSSETVSALMARAAETSGTLKSLKVRYDAIANALAGYSPTLRSAQATSLEALHEADRAQTRARNAANHGNAAIPHMLSLDEGERQRAFDTYNHYNQEATTARGELGAAKARLRTAISQRNEAADKAADAINAVVDNSSLNDSVLDKVGAFLEWAAKGIGEILKWVWDHLDVILLVIDAIALIIFCIPGGQLIAGGIFAFTKVIGAIKSSIDFVGSAIELVKAVGTGFRTGDWGPCVKAYGKYVIDGAALTLSIVGFKGVVTGFAGGLKMAAKALVKTEASDAVSTVAEDVGFIAVNKIWENIAPKSTAAPAAERKAVPCW